MCSDRNTPTGAHPDLPQKQKFEAISSNRSAPGPCVSRPPYGSRSGTSQTLRHTGYDTHKNHTRSARHQTRTKHHERETQRLLSASHPISPRQGHFDQRTRHGSNSPVVSDSMSLAYTHDRSAMPYRDSIRGQSEQEDDGCRNSIYDESFRSAEESHCTREADDYARDDHSSYSYQGSASPGDAYEEDSDRYAGDNGFDEDGYSGDDSGDDDSSNDDSSNDDSSNDDFDDYDEDDY
ncbi:hypothetical protein GQX73_g3560 [Xylaria multiplex]|uniref:Uncharacterized protein n=1 Tax=Xylaria multiplex TaxID=323545 RepID=A0A7C8N0D6_9PEZI|nr:hypothetical protein GQX73_g3560 [Xylaria multiplex]